MTPNNSTTENPLKFIQSCVKDGKLLWTYHVNMRMRDRFIHREHIVNSTENYEIIEEYPNDKYFPSYLIYSRYQNWVFHVLFAVDTDEDNVRIVTAYSPDLDEWEEDLKTRRRPK